MLNFQEHLLAALAEEAAEVGQMAGKCLRFMEVAKGIVLVPSDNGKGDAPIELGTELTDLLAVIEMLQAEGFPLVFGSRENIEAKKERIRKYWSKMEVNMEEVH